jgi:glycosyltransferase involved in cell wall biosynthesis/GT2 family glycosyltransferase
MFLHGSAGAYGIDRQLYLLASGLDRSRYEPLVVLPELGDLAARLQAAEIEVHVAPLAVLRRNLLRGRGLVSTIALAARNASELGELARVRRVSVVHSSSSLILCGQAVADRAGAVHVQHVRELYEGLGGRAGRTLWPVVSTRLARANVLVCVSEVAAEQFGGVGRTVVLSDGIPDALTLPDRGDARRGLGLPDGAFVVSVLGHISDWKGHAVLLRALAQPELAQVEAIGLVAGEPAPDQQHFRRELVELQEELGLQDRVRLLGFRADIETILAASDAVAVPSIHPDAFASAALEAAAAALPVVATSLGAHAEIVRDGVTGRLVPPADAHALAGALRELAEDPAGARRLGESAAADVRTRFAAARSLERVQATYDQLLERAPRSAWLLPARTVEPDPRVARMEAWVRNLGYEPAVLRPSHPLSGVRLAVRACRERPRLVIAGSADGAPVVGCLKRLRKRRPLLVAGLVEQQSLSLGQAPPPGWVHARARRIRVLAEERLLRSVDAVIAFDSDVAELVRSRYRPMRVHTLCGEAGAERADEEQEGAFRSLLDDHRRLPRRARSERAAPRLVTAVVPVRNGAEHIGAQLAALSAQTYQGAWEVVVVDNGSTDATVEVVETWRDRLPGLRIVDASERAGVSHALNRGADEARGEFIVSCDADDVADPDWLESLVEMSTQGDVVAGLNDFESLNPPEQRAWRQEATSELLPLTYSFLPLFDQGNCGLWREVAAEIRRDEDYPYGSSDEEYSWRVQLAGYRVVAAPRAVMRKRFRLTLRTLARQWFDYGHSEPHLYRSFRHCGMPRPDLATTLEGWWLLLVHAPDLLRSSGRRGNWLRLAGLGAGRVVGSIRWRVLFLSTELYSSPVEVPAAGLHLLEFGSRWPPETFVSRKLERLSALGMRVTVASFLDSGDPRSAPPGIGHVRVLDPRQGALGVWGRGGTSLARLLVRSPGQIPRVARAAAAATSHRLSRREAAERFAAYATLAALKPDVVHIDWLDVENEYSSLADALDCPIVVSCHGSELRVDPYTPEGRPLAAAIPQVFRRAAAVHCAAEALAADAVRFGAESAKNRVIRGAVDTAVFRPAPRTSGGGPRFAIVSVATLHWAKGLEYALLALARLVEDGVPASLDIVGGDPEWDAPSDRDRLVAAVGDLGLEERVRFHGWVPPEVVRDRLQASDVFLQSSLSEGHPTAVVEAMACGLPIVATDCGGTREAMTQGVEGFLVPPRDWRAAAAALRTLWKDPSLRHRMGLAGRERVETEFTLERQSAEFAALYRDVVDRCS